MKTIIVLSLLVSSVAVCDDSVPSEQQIQETLVSTMEVSRRAIANGMSYQILKRCGMDAETLADIKAFLYKDIEKVKRLYPSAGVNVDALFEEASEQGNEFYETTKNNPKICEGLLEEAKKYLGG